MKPELILINFSGDWHHHFPGSLACNLYGCFYLDSALRGLIRGMEEYKIYLISINTRMTNPKILIVLPFLLLSLLVFSSVQAQTNYKHPQINAKGEFMDAQGIKQGWITKEGLIMDAKGKKLAFLDANGNLVDSNGKKMGRAAKNGTYYDEKGAVVLTVSEPKGEQCEVVDKSGKVIASVHNNYKTQAACMVHCLSTKMEMKP